MKLGNLRFRVWGRSLLMCGGLAVASSAFAQTLESLAARQQEKLEQALARLEAERNRIQEEQIPLARRLADLQARNEELRDRLGASRRARDSRDLSLEALQQQIEARRQEQDYITRTLFAEWFATLEASLSPGETATYGRALREHNLFLEQADVPELEKLRRGLELVTRSRERLETLPGGRRYEGEAWNDEGNRVPGTFVQVGPLLYFAGSAPANSGWVTESKTLQPRIRPLPETAGARLMEVAEKGEGPLPMDPTLGDALAIQETRETLAGHLRKGGIWVYPIMAFALIATLVALFKLVQVFTIRHPAPLVVHDLVKEIRAGRLDQAQALAAVQPGPGGVMLRSAVEHADESIELVEEVMYESMLNTQPRLERFLNVIAVTAATAPLLGLLGTVTGIIKTFKLMQVFGAGDPKPLISGISEALITTELGLVLAIPALVIHALLARKVAGVLSRMEKLSVAFVNGLSRRRTEGWTPIREADTGEEPKP